MFFDADPIGKDDKMFWYANGRGGKDDIIVLRVLVTPLAPTSSCLLSSIITLFPPFVFSSPDLRYVYSFLASPVSPSRCWINTAFVRGNTVTLTKNALDDAIKDTKCNNFPAHFQVEFVFADATPDQIAECYDDSVRLGVGMALTVPVSVSVWCLCCVCGGGE